MISVNMMVRIPPEVRDWVQGEAKKDDRSMNWLIVSILKRAMDAQKENAPAAATAEAPI